MLAWMDDNALRLARETAEAHFFSRSRGLLWRKAVDEVRDYLWFHIRRVS